MNTILLIEGAVVLVIGGLVGYISRHYVAIAKRGSIEADIEEKLLQAKRDAHTIEDEALTKASVLRDEMKRAEERIIKQEERLDKREQELIRRDNEVAKEIADIKEKGRELQELKEKIEKKEQSISNELENVARLTSDEAKELLINRIEREAHDDLQLRTLKLARDGEVKLEEKARDILVSSIYRIANGQIAQFMTATVEIDNDEIKGKIIGKEGRNIKTFERLSGVEVLVDEVPNGIVVSCFDPVRRAIAVNALEMLIKDGRIQPVKIEECLEKAKKEIGVFMRKKGEEAVLVCGLLSIPEELIPIIGRLYFRTSYGQNVLDHSIEMAHIAGVLATELGVDVHV
ncbi:Rnase Y domain-containing protein, partial [Candidatus Gracilibacteria bacterium]|nr:Rnase Y domain-containing protein [Candidatus Gracilibacteria bacterium]